LSGELDAAIAAEIDRHVGKCGACAARLAELQNLTAAIKSRGVEPMPSALEARIRARMPQQEPVRLPLLRGRRVWAVAGALAIVLALMSGLLVNRRGPSAAAEVVARAERNLGRLSAYHIRWCSTSYSGGSKVATTCIEVWAKAPGLSRTEMTSSGAVGKTIIITQSTVRAVIDTGSQVVSMWPLSHDEKEHASQALAIGSAYDLARRHPSTMRIVGTAKVLGRTCDVIEWQIGHHSRDQIALDRATGLLLRWASYRDGELGLLMEATELQVNEPISNSLFDLSLPKGTAVVKGPIPQVDPRLLNDRDTWGTMEEDVRSVLDNKVYPIGLEAAYTPSYLPAGYQYVGVHWLSDPNKEPSDQGNPRCGINIDCINPDTGDTLIITEKSPEIPASGREIPVGNVTGHIETFEKPFIYAILTWTEGDTHFQISASGLKPDEVVRVAESLRQLNP
jgi:outer membrane lipoprotein-sorting protein